MVELIFVPSDYYPGGRWEVRMNGALLDYFFAKWEAEKYIGRLNT
jgi:hypothetical protein